MTVIAEEGMAPETVFRKHLAEGELWLQTCVTCSKQIFYPRVVCPHCGGKPEWNKASGQGTVYSTTIVRQRPDRGGDYNVCVVELREGARMMTRVEGIPPTDVKIGMVVKAAIIDSDGGKLVVFHPVTGGAK
jgi:uncharacterized OB-fold protein